VRVPSDFLCQLNGTVPIDPDHTSLARRLSTLGNIVACSKELSSGEHVGQLFPEPHSRKHLHIVVQCPDIVLAPSSPRATGRKERNPESITCCHKNVSFHFLGRWLHLPMPTLWNSCSRLATREITKHQTRSLPVLRSSQHNHLLLSIMVNYR
jgi:hypothetical protein